MSLLKNYRIIVWIIFIVAALALIGFNPDTSGSKISFVGKNAPQELKIGMILYDISGEKISPEVLNRNYSGIVKLGTNKGAIYTRLNGTLDVDIEPVQSTNLKFGLDIKGGVHALIKLNESTPEVADQVKSTLQTRINVFGLREAVFRTVTVGKENFIDISIAGGNKQELLDLLQTQGKFEGKITFYPPGSLTLDKKYDISFVNNTALIANNSLKPGDTFTISNIDFVYNGKNGNRANLTALIFTGRDIKTVFFDPQRSRIENTGQSYQWSFAIQISPESADRFAKITKNTASLGQYLDAQIFLYLDNSNIDTLNIASTLKGQAETEISITGGANSMQQAVAERSRLQAVLRSGALPTSIEVVSIDTISPTLGADFLNSAIFAGIGAIIGVVAIVLIRYRKLKLVIPMVATSLSEVIIIVGFATGLGWTIDLPAIAAIIATVGTGINSQIIIIDQALRKTEFHVESLKEKFKRAFFIIFGSAGTMIAAMLPMFFSGLDLLRGFAVVTVIGVLAGVLVARPAFSVIIERVLKKNDSS